MLYLVFLIHTANQKQKSELNTTLWHYSYLKPEAQKTGALGSVPQSLRQCSWLEHGALSPLDLRLASASRAGGQVILFTTDGRWNSRLCLRDEVRSSVTGEAISRAAASSHWKVSEVVRSLRNCWRDYLSHLAHNRAMVQSCLCNQHVDCHSCFNFTFDLCINRFSSAVILMLCSKREVGNENGQFMDKFEFNSPSIQHQTSYKHVKDDSILILETPGENHHTTAGGATHRSSRNLQLYSAQQSATRHTCSPWLEDENTISPEMQWSYNLMRQAGF